MAICTAKGRFAICLVGVSIASDYHNECNCFHNGTHDDFMNAGCHVAIVSSMFSCLAQRRSSQPGFALKNGFTFVNVCSCSLSTTFVQM